MRLFGVDVSHHQGDSLNWPALKRSGIEFAFIKATEGGSFTDPMFARNLRGARVAGLLVAAYHYVRADASAAAQAARVAGVVPKDIPVIPDVEKGSGDVKLLRAFITELRNAGYQVPLTYLPRWYWQQLGSPSLAGLPSLWSSRYPDNVVGSITDEYDDVPQSYWAGYGGLGVSVLQFTSSMRVPGYAGNLDGNAFLGTREQLEALLGLGGKEYDVSDMYDKVTFTLPDGSVIEKTHSEIVAELYRAHLISALAPRGETVHDAIWKNRETLDELRARALADVDEEALAEAMATHGIVGATPAQVKSALREVFASLSTAPVTS